MRGGIRLYFYPRPPRGGRLLRLDQTIDQQAISIHALREEGDTNRASKKCGVENFYPRPPRGGRHEQAFGYQEAWAISIHALREEGDLIPTIAGWGLNISIHALREEGDINIWKGASERPNFYPRPPRGGRRSCRVVSVLSCQISIHALREEGDLRSLREHLPQRQFLSTPSARRATGLIPISRVCPVFLSTPSARRAT